MTVSSNHRPLWMSTARFRALRCPDCGSAPVTFESVPRNVDVTALVWLCAGMERHRNVTAWAAVEMEEYNGNH